MFAHYTHCLSILNNYCILFLQIQACIEFEKKIDACIPPTFVDEFREMTPTFLDPYCKFMKSLKGPAYRPHVFEHIDLLKKTDVIYGLVDIPHHDIIDMTQPSQHVSQSEGACTLSSCRPPKMQLHRLKEGK